MERYKIFVDFGSTFTKCAVFDMEDETLAARLQTPSTVDTDVTEGLLTIFSELKKVLPVTDEEIKNATACSSAAGGLRLCVIGLVPDYTTKAGYLAALSAGAKVVGSFSYELSKSEIKDIEILSPDIILLTGGTDGGNKRTIIHNAQMLADSAIDTIIVAGNKSARDEIEEIFEDRDKNITFVTNVMPEFGDLDLGPVNEKIREIFISRIMDAKGISRAEQIIKQVAMPTPYAILEAARVISQGAEDEEGLGELLVIDVGGATTDVYSIAKGYPKRGVHLLGLREPYIKRTVEGDLGLYHNLDTLTEVATENMEDNEKAELKHSVGKLAAKFSIPDSGDLWKHQTLLTKTAVTTAATRHGGRIEPKMTAEGEKWIQRGKDLTGVKLIIGSGGPVIYAEDPKYILQAAGADPENQYVLLPVDPQYAIDSNYILFAIGLLAQSQPGAALRIAKKYLKKL